MSYENKVIYNDYVVDRYSELVYIKLDVISNEIFDNLGHGKTYKILNEKANQSMYGYFIEYSQEENDCEYFPPYSFISKKEWRQRKIKNYLDLSE